MFEYNQNEDSWNLNVQPSDKIDTAFFTEIQDSMSNPELWNSVRRNMEPSVSQHMGNFPASDSLLGDMRDAGPRAYDQPVQLTYQEAQDNFLETALKAPSLLMESWNDVSGIGMAQEMVLAVLQNPEAMKLAVMALQVGLFAA